jgi:hypothetical protein
MCPKRAIWIGAGYRFGNHPDAECCRRRQRGADVVVTDTWISMGQAHADEKLASLRHSRSMLHLWREAKPDARFLHCLPAHVGEEVSEEVFEGPQSVVFDEAENRIHAQKSVLLWCFGLLAQIGPPLRGHMRKSAGFVMSLAGATSPCCAPLLSSGLPDAIRVTRIARKVL